MISNPFLRIETIYQELDKHNEPFFDTAQGTWAGSIPKEVFAVFKQIGLSPFHKFLDLGSGDGRVVFIAALFCNEVTGIESDKELLNKSLMMKEKLDVKFSMHVKEVKFINQDYQNHDLSEYNYIFINPDKPFYKGTEEKLLKELKGKLIVYGNAFLPLKLREVKSFFIEGTRVGVYEKP